MQVFVLLRKCFCRRFCILQYTDAGDCFSEKGYATENVDVLEAAATAQCPHQLIRRQVALFQ